MIWRAALTGLTAVVTAATTPAMAQWFPQWELDGRRPFWEQQPRQALGNPPGEIERQPIIRGGGARPLIEPEAPEKVVFHSNFTPNSIIIDSAGRKLYFVLSPTEAYRYPISVGREGFSWTGTGLPRISNCNPKNKCRTYITAAA
jgi:lipoprotein-anchoring transpeptidase ErfK/SrfK